MAKRIRVAVKPAKESKWLYGFLTKTGTDGAMFGHVDCENGTAPEKTVIFSPSGVKPLHASKSLVSGTSSSYADSSRVQSLITADYSLSRKRNSIPKSTAKSKIVGVLLELGVYWCWRMPVTRWASIPSDIKTEAGIIEITTFDPDKHVYNANAFILKGAAGSFAPGQIVDKADLRKSFTNPTTGKKIRLYAKLNDA